MIKDIDTDLERCFDTKHWPGEIETLGSAHLDAMMVAHAVRQERIATNNQTTEVIKAPTFSTWAPNVDEDYKVLFLNHSQDYLTSLTHDNVAYATDNDDQLRRLRSAVAAGSEPEIQYILKEMNHPKIGQGTTVQPIDLFIYKNCIMVQNRLWIPKGLEQEVATILHIGHKGVDNMMKVAKSLCYWSGITDDLKDVSTECIQCRTQAPLPPNTGDHPPSPEPEYPGEMISIDVGQMPNGINFLCIADRFSGYVWAKQLRGAGESNQIIRFIMESLSGLFLGTRRISSDNASNFTSYEFVNWANRFSIILDNSAAWNPAGNMHAETNIKKTKRAVKGLCGSFGMRLDDERIQSTQPSSELPSSPPRSYYTPYT